MNRVNIEEFHWTYLPDKDHCLLFYHLAYIGIVQSSRLWDSTCRVGSGTWATWLDGWFIALYSCLRTLRKQQYSWGTVTMAAPLSHCGPVKYEARLHSAHIFMVFSIFGCVCAWRDVHRVWSEFNQINVSLCCTWRDEPSMWRGCCRVL